MGDVEYGFIQTADEIPGGRGGRGGSRLNDMVDEIIEHGEKGAYCIAVYVKKTAAGGAANVMRQRYGRNIGVRSQAGVRSWRMATSVRDCGFTTILTPSWTVSLPSTRRSRRHARLSSLRS
jgi:hypothetical protein